MDEVKNNPAIGRRWADVRKELFTEEEIAESDREVATMLNRLEKER